MKDKIHEWFELSYAQYLAIPRSILQTMPDEWQEKFVELLNELDEKIEWRRSGCFVKFRRRNGKWMQDYLSDYRHTNYTPEQIKEAVDSHNELYEL